MKNDYLKLVLTIPFVILAIATIVFYFLKKKKCSVLVKAYISSGKRDTISTQIGEGWVNLPYYHPTFEFDYQGKHYQIKDKIGTSAKKYAVNTTVDLYIDPTNPNNYLTLDFRKRLIIITIEFLIMGAVPFLLF